MKISLELEDNDAIMTMMDGMVASHVKTTLAMLEKFPDDEEYTNKLKEAMEVVIDYFEVVT